MTHLFFTRTWFLMVGLRGCALMGAPARAAEERFDDRLTVMGDTLRGRVVGLTTRAVEFRTVYGDGEETTGRVIGVQDEQVLVGEDADTAESVPVESIRGVALQARFEESFLTRLRARFPCWKHVKRFSR